MDKRFLIAWVVIFVLSMLGGFVVHEMLLKADYARLTQLFRSHDDVQKHFGFMVLAHVLIAGAFVWIYRQGIGE